MRELFRQIRRSPSAVFAKNYTAERCGFSQQGWRRARVTGLTYCRHRFLFPAPAQLPQSGGFALAQFGGKRAAPGFKIALEDAEIVFRRARPFAEFRHGRLLSESRSIVFSTASC